MPGKKRKLNHREVLAVFEEYVMNKNLGISEHGKDCIYFVHSILKPYAVIEQAEADAKKNASQDAQNAPESTEQVEKVSTVMQGGEA